MSTSRETPCITSGVEIVYHSPLHNPYKNGPLPHKWQELCPQAADILKTVLTNHIDTNISQYYIWIFQRNAMKSVLAKCSEREF